MRRQSQSDQSYTSTKAHPHTLSSRTEQTREPFPIPSNNPASQYTLLEKLGTGSFGTVYKALHNETKQIVAVKQIGMSRIHCILPYSALSRPRGFR